MPKSNPEKLNDSINVPVQKSLKARLLQFANRLPTKPSHTRVARILLKDGLDRFEREGIDSPGSPFAAAEAEPSPA